MHDYIVFINQDVAWMMGGAIKNADKKATDLIPLQTSITPAKKQMPNYLRVVNIILTGIATAAMPVTNR